MNSGHREVVVSFLPELFDTLLSSARVMVQKNKLDPILNAVWLDQNGSVKDAGFFFAADSTSSEIDAHLRTGIETGIPGSGLGPADVMACLVFSEEPQGDRGVLVSIRTQDLCLDQFVPGLSCDSSFPDTGLDLKLARPHGCDWAGLAN
jgi:hypothetical protein